MLALPQLSEIPLDHTAELPSLVPAVSTEPMPLEVPTLEDSISPLLPEVDDEEPNELEDESLSPIPAFTLAEATPGTPPLTDAPAFQLSTCPAEPELLLPALVVTPLLVPLVLVAVLPANRLSLCAELATCVVLPPLIELSPCDWLVVSDQLSEWPWLSVWLWLSVCP